MTTSVREELAELFTGDPTFLSSFCDIVVRPSEKARFIVLCNILVDFFESQGHSVKLICWAISQEFQRHSHSQGTLFRGSTIATQFLHVFLKNVGTTYLKSLTSNILSEIYAKNNSFELNPNNCASHNEIQQNIEVLFVLAKKFLADLRSSVIFCPIALRIVLSHVRHEISQKFPTLCRMILGNIFFLRFICPALISPEEYNLVTDPPQPNIRRGLVALSKVIQNLANGIEFRQSEPYMQPFNSFILENRDRIAEFFDSLSSLKELGKVENFRRLDMDQTSHRMTKELSNDLTNVLSYYISVKRSLWKLTSHRIEEVYNVLSLTIQQNFSKLEQHLIQNSKTEVALRLRQIVQNLSLADEKQLHSPLQKQISKARKSQLNDTTNVIISPSSTTLNINSETVEKAPPTQNVDATSKVDVELSTLRELRTMAKLNAELAESNKRLLARIEELEKERITVEAMKQELIREMTAMFNEMKNSIAQEIKQYLLTTIRQDIVTLMQRVQAKTVEEVLLELEDKTDDDNSKTVTKLDKPVKKESSEFSREIKILKKKLTREHQKIESLEMKLEKICTKKTSNHNSNVSSLQTKNNTNVSTNDQEVSQFLNEKPSRRIDSKEIRKEQISTHVESYSVISSPRNPNNQMLSNYLTSTSTRRKLPSVLIRDSGQQHQIQQQSPSPSRSQLHSQQSQHQSTPSRSQPKTQTSTSSRSQIHSQQSQHQSTPSRSQIHSQQSQHQSTPSRSQIHSQQSQHQSTPSRSQLHLQTQTSSPSQLQNPTPNETHSKAQVSTKPTSPNNNTNSTGTYTPLPPFIFSSSLRPPETSQLPPQPPLPSGVRQESGRLDSKRKKESSQQKRKSHKSHHRNETSSNEKSHKKKKSSKTKRQL